MAKVFMGMSLTKRIEGELYHIWSAYTALYQADRDADFVRAHLRGVKSVRVLPMKYKKAPKKIYAVWYRK